MPTSIHRKADIVRYLSCAALAATLFLAASLPARAAQAPHPSPRVGLVLSGGGARGGAHIGVLKVLEREGIPIDCIAGTSFGALVGGFYALGYSAAEIERIFVDQDWDELFSDSPDRRLAPITRRRDARYLAELNFNRLTPELPTGMWSGQKLTQVFDRYTTERVLAAGYDFDRLHIPFRAVATDLLTGKPHVFRNGRMTEAFRASSAIPMIFTPVEKDGTLLVDGGLVDNLPADLAREMGAEVIIAVDTTAPLLEKNQIRSFLDVMDQTMSLTMKASVDRNVRHVDLMLRPDLTGFSYSSYGQIGDIVPRGEKAAEESLHDLRRIVRGRTRPAAPPAAPTAKPVIDSVKFSGLERVPERQIRGEVHSQPGHEADIHTIGEDVARLYATRLFERVDYDLKPADGGRYQLAYSMRESALNNLAASMRYDKDYKFVALADFNARQLFGTSSSATLSNQFGGLTNHTATLRLSLPRLPDLFVEPEVHLRRRERQDVRNQELADKFTDRRIGGQLRIGSVFFKGFEVSAGYRNERMTVAGGTLPNRQEGARSLAGATLRFDRDTLDHPGFPLSGTLLTVRLEKFSGSLGGDFDYSTWQADLDRYFALSEHSTLRVRGTAALSRGPLPFQERFYLGGYNFSEGGPRQLLGFGRDELAAPQAMVLGGSYSHRVFSRPLSFVRRGFVTLHYNAAGTSQRQEPTSNFSFFHGGALELSLDTLAGPIRIAGGWGEQGRFKIYLSLGPAF
jgi:NTE family protein